MKSSIAISMLTLLWISGCKPSNESIFYWGDYSETLYDLKHEPGDSTLAAHQAQLLVIINTAPKEKKKIPPGVCAEYGYILLRTGNMEEGARYLDQEMALYPESEVFIKRLKNRYSKGEK